MPPPAMPASVLNVMPPGVMLVSSRLTTITPLASGISITMHSKQPQAVIGVSMMEYIVTFSTDSLRVRVDVLVGAASSSPSSGRARLPLRIGWLGPVGLISNDALQSSQL